ncbi:MAG: DNA polymerase III subunit gamma/tau [Bacilli bacterium]
MDYKVLYRKYRPQSFSDVSGQDYSMQVLKNAITSDKIAHAYIFTGPRGTGKTSTAKIFAKAINCTDLKDGNPCGHCACCINDNNPDIIEIDAASNNGVDEIRELINNVKIAPSYSKYKVYIIDEVHMLSTSAFNALLLTLEEPPGNVVFILATTDVQNVPVTILSRCQRFDFKPISEEKIFDRLMFICKNENISITDEALKEIAYVANGGLRDALSILDQLSSTKSEISIDDVYQNFGTVSSIKIEGLINSFINGDINNVCLIINEFKENGINYVVLIEKIINKLKELALQSKVGKNSVSFDLIYELIVSLNDCLNSANINLNPYILIELTMIKYMKTDQNYFPGNNFEKKEDEIISREIIEDEKASENENIQEANKDQLLNVMSDQVIEIRVNNCFVKANKQFKADLINIWESFLEQISLSNKSLYSIFVDSSIVLASDEYAVLVDKNDSTCTLINKKLNVISEEFANYTNKNYKFVCLTEEKWNYNMDVFKKNKKDGIIYEYINENDTSIQDDNESESDDNELNVIAEDLFDSSIVEYE